MKIRPTDNYFKEKIAVQWILAGLADYRIKKRKKNKILELGRQIRKLWNMIAIGIDTLGTVPKNLEKGPERIRNRKMNSKPFIPIALLRSARILRRVLET